MEGHHILLLEQDYSRVRDHVFETLNKTKRKTKYRVQPGYNDIDLYDTSPVASDISRYHLILHR